MTTKKIPKAPEPYTPAWYKAKTAAMEEDYGDQYHSCPHCGWPTHKTYICRVCRE